MPRRSDRAAAPCHNPCGDGWTEKRCRLFLPSGASYQIDQGQKTLPPDLVKAMKPGTNLNIGMESVTRKPVTPVSLAGFSAALTKLESIK